MPRSRVPNDRIFFDTATTQMRPTLLEKAIAAGKHIYCEKPIATNLAEALKICRLAKAKGVKNGTVQDKLFLPGLQKIKMLRDSRLLRPHVRGPRRVRLLGVRGRLAAGPAPLLELSHRRWRRHRPRHGLPLALRARQSVRPTSSPCPASPPPIFPSASTRPGKRYAATADDAAYATFQLEGGVIAHINMSWAVRVYRDDLVTFQVDGTLGSAVAGLTDCMIQPRTATPRPVWNPDQKQTIDFYDTWQKVPDNVVYDNGFKAEWEMFIRHVVEDAPFPHTLVEGAKGVQLVECALQSWKERRWVDVPALQGLRRQPNRGGHDVHHPAPARRRRSCRALYLVDGARISPTGPRDRSIASPLAAAHVVADPPADIDPWLKAAPDWERTIAYREYLWDLGLGVAEAMDTAQRGMGLDWPMALELIKRSVAGGARPRRRGRLLRAPAPIISTWPPRDRSTR